jgi:hypothetical protein
VRWRPWGVARASRLLLLLLVVLNRKITPCTGLRG